MRARVEDFNFATNTVLIREKKKSKDRETFRVVDMTATLAEVMQIYYAGNHPGGVYAFGIEANEPVSPGESRPEFVTGLPSSRLMNFNDPL